MMMKQQPAPIVDWPALECPECSRPMPLIRRRRGYFYRCERFPTCSGRHSAHDDGRPHGVPAGSETKHLRTVAHAALDELVRARRWRLADAYRWLAREMRLSYKECHIGRFDLATCNRAIEICNQEASRPLDRHAKRRGRRSEQLRSDHQEDHDEEV